MFEPLQAAKMQFALTLSCAFQDQCLSSTQSITFRCSSDTPMIRVLILCTGNSTRSQIAEGLFRNLGGDEFDVHSAGTHPAGLVHPLAIETMRERGIDISNQTSKSLSSYDEQPFDYVVTVCDEAYQECPIFPGAKNQIHWSTPDPSFAPGDGDERKEAFRHTTASLERRVMSLIAEIRNTKAAS